MGKISDPQRQTLAALRDGGHTRADAAGWPPHAASNCLNRLYCMGLADRLGAPGSRRWWITPAGLQVLTPEDAQIVTTPEDGFAFTTRGA